MKKIVFVTVLVCAVLSLHAQAGVFMKSDFEDGKTGDWSGRGSALLAVTADSAHSGKYSLFTSGRSQNWNGPSIDLSGKVSLTGVYSFSAWVKIKEGQPDADLIMTVQRDAAGGSGWDRVTQLDAKTGTWVNVSGTYEPKTAFDKIAMYIESSNPTLEYYIDDVSIQVMKAPQTAAALGVPTGLIVPSLAEAYKNNFIVGAAVELNQLTGKEGELLLRHFSGITPENIMKPQYMTPSEGVYNFDSADKLADFAAKNNLKLRGHTLVWHSQNAEWMFYDDKGNKVSKQVLLDRMEKYVTTVVSRYKGKVFAWDVVNEVVDGAGMRNSLWYEIAGEEYVERAFLAARKADPDAKLFINEYGVTDPVKGDTLYKLVKKLRDKKVPVDGVGMQFHISIDYPSIQAVTDTLRKFSDLGVEIHITELDMSLNADPNVTSGDAPEALLIRQGHRYKELFDVFKAFKAVKDVTFWGFHDGHTWLTGFPVKKADWPLPFDGNFNAKYAYWGLTDPSKLPADVALTVDHNNFTAVAPKGTPVIDGREDDVWKKASEMKINIYIEGKGAYGIAKALWDDGNLYVLVKVADAKLSKASRNAYEQDTVEIFIDEKNNKSVDYLEDDVQYRINYENEMTVKGTPSDIQSAAMVTKDGYTVEAKIPLRFAKPASGTTVGFDLQINDDSTGTGVRDSYSKWNDPTNETYRNTSGFGTLVFGK